MLNLFRSEFVKSSYFVFLVGLLISSLNYGFNIVLVRDLSIEQYTIFAGILAGVTLIQYAMSGVENSLTRQYGQSLKGKVNKSLEISKFRQNYALFSLILSTALIVFSPVIEHFSKIPVGYIFVVAILIFPLTYSAHVRAYLMGAGHIRRSYGVQLIDAFIKFSLTLPLLYFARDTYSGLIAWLLSALIAMFLGDWMVRRHNESLMNAESASEKSLQQFQPKIVPILVNVAILGCFYAGFTLDVMLVDVGIRGEYGALALLGKILFFGAVIMVPVLFATVAGMRQSEYINTRQYLAATVAFTATAGGVATLLFYSFNEIIIKIVLGEKYLSLSGILPLYGLGMSVFSIAFVLMNYFLARGYLKIIYILALVPVLQIALFYRDSSSVEIAVQNQMVVWGYLVFTLLIFGLLRFFLRGRGKVISR